MFDDFRGFHERYSDEIHALQYAKVDVNPVLQTIRKLVEN